MKLKIRVLDQDDINVEVPNNASIDTLSKTIAENSNMPTNQQRLIFRGQLMQPGSLLSDYGVEDGCVIHMVKRNTVFHKIYSIQDSAHREAASAAGTNDSTHSTTTEQSTSRTVV